MSDLILNKILNSITPMPWNGLRIRICPFVEDEEIVTIHYLEEESSYKITPKARDDRRGGKITLGYDIEAIAYISHNNYGANNMLERLENLNNLPNREDIKFWNFILMIGDKIMETPPSHSALNTYSGAGFWIELTNSRITVEMESVQLRPRLIIKTNQFVKSMKSIILTEQG